LIPVTEGLCQNATGAEHDAVGADIDVIEFQQLCYRNQPVEVMLKQGCILLIEVCGQRQVIFWQKSFPLANSSRTILTGG